MKWECKLPDKGFGNKTQVLWEKTCKQWGASSLVTHIVTDIRKIETRARGFTILLTNQAISFTLYFVSTQVE